MEREEIRIEEEKWMVRSNEAEREREREKKTKKYVMVATKAPMWIFVYHFIIRCQANDLFVAIWFFIREMIIYIKSIIILIDFKVILFGKDLFL